MKNFRGIFAAAILYITAATALGAEYLIPGGQVIGLELQDNTVTIAAFEDHLGNVAQEAGLKEGDQILRINDTKIHSAEDVRKVLLCSRGRVDICVLRKGKTKTLSMTPSATSDGPKLGVYLKQGTTGVGTVTYYRTDSDDFAALGHGVNTKNGNLLSMSDGNVYAARVNGVTKGIAGTPGQLLGVLTELTPIGTLSRNTAQGVFGNVPAPTNAKALPVADPEEVHTGAATIRSTVDGSALREYSVEILKIYPNNTSRTRNMLIQVRDPNLLKTTGGIVQGMSGSPIIQDGKLVGAVTHVLVNDPTTGYGIFIENMLDAAA